MEGLLPSRAHGKAKVHDSSTKVKRKNSYKNDQVVRKLIDFDKRKDFCLIFASTQANFFIATWVFENSLFEKELDPHGTCVQFV